MSVTRFLPTETNAMSVALIARYEKAISIGQKLSASDTMDTYISELPASRNYSANSIPRMVSAITAYRDRLHETVYATRSVYAARTLNSTSSEKELVHSKSAIELSVINKLINNHQQDVFTRLREIKSSSHPKTKLVRRPSNSMQKSFTSEKTSKLFDQQQNITNLSHLKLGMERTHKCRMEVGAINPHSIAKVLRLELEKSPAIEAAIAFPDPTLLEQLSLTELSELEIDGPDDFCLFIATEADGCYFDLVYSFNPVLELAENFGWFPSIEVFTVSQAEEAGGLENLASNWSPLVHSIFHR